jgi:hypothetical protein
MTRYLPRRHVPLSEKLWAAHNPRWRGAVWDNDIRPLAYTNCDHILDYKVYHVNRDDFQTCDGHFPSGSIVHGYYSDPNEILAVTSDGRWHFRWRFEPRVYAALPRPRELRAVPRFASFDRCAFIWGQELPF